MNKNYDLDLIEYKLKKKYKESMEHLNGLRAAIDSYAAESTVTKFEQLLAADLCCSIQAEACLNDPDDVPRYKYIDGTCKFYVDGVEFIVADLYDMSRNKYKEVSHFDVCCVLCSYKDGEVYHWNFVPDAWSYGSTLGDFEEYHEVCDIFLDKCSQFIKEHGGAEYLREMQKDEEE